MFSEHFLLSELTHTDTGLPNEPTLDALASLQRLCEVVLEPSRTLLGTPMHVNSAYRSAEVNVAIGGARSSQHMLGLACDFVPVGMDLEEAFKKLKASSIPFDQLILEPTWIHVSAAPPDRKPRRQTLRAVFKNGKPVYSEY